MKPSKAGLQKPPDKVKTLSIPFSFNALAINALPLIRKALGPEFPLIFDSGIRSGGDIVRALAFGADYVMIGRPLMYAIGADGAQGLRKIIEIIKGELSTTLGLVGLTDINDITSEIIAQKFFKDIKY